MKENTKANKRFSKADDKVIAKEVGNCPQNFHSAFKAAAEKLGRTARGVEQHWYRKVRYQNAVMFTFGRKGHIINGKVGSKGNKPIKHSMGFWKSLLNIYE